MFSNEMGREQTKASKCCNKYSTLGKVMSRQCKDMFTVVNFEGIQRG